MTEFAYALINEYDDGSDHPEVVFVSASWDKIKVATYEYWESVLSGDGDYPLDVEDGQSLVRVRDWLDGMGPTPAQAMGRLTQGDRTLTMTTAIVL